MGGHHSKHKHKHRREKNKSIVNKPQDISTTTTTATTETATTTTTTTTTIVISDSPAEHHDADEKRVVIRGGDEVRMPASLRESVIFEEDGEAEVGAGDECIGHHHETQSCSLCEAVADKDKVYSLEFCGHSFCIPCIFAYSKDKLEDLPDDCCELHCPLSGCGCAISVVDLKSALATFGGESAQADVIVEGGGGGGGSSSSSSGGSGSGSGSNASGPSQPHITLPIQLTQSLEQLLSKSDNYVRCPNPKCRFVFERLPPTRSNEVVLDENGKPLSSVAIKHRQLHRFRCRACDTIFCAACKTMPYHLGFTCKEYFVAKAAKHCRFCDVALPANTKPHFPSSSSASGGHKRERSKSIIVWWKEKAKKKGSKKDRVHRLSVGSSKEAESEVDEELSKDVIPKEFYLCSGAECRANILHACYTLLDCGHYCGALNADACMCLKPGCASSQHDGDDYCAICWVEALKSAPTVKLACGHLFHYNCVMKKLRARWPGPSISFAFAACPLCHVTINHNAFASEMARIDNLQREVKRKAVERLAIEGMQDDPQLTMEGSKYYKNPEEYAVHIFAFYECHLCKHAYFGGRRQCEEAENVDMSKHNPAELICGGCSTIHAECATHGKEYIDFKCRFCCSLATYFCGGKAHFCNPCHDKAGQLVEFTNWTTIGTCPPCKGGGECPIGVAHAPNGEEFAMGCSMCRATVENT